MNKILFAVFMLATSCTGTESPKNVTAESDQHTTDKERIDTSLYLQVGNPDTALAIFMFKECYNYDYDLQREEYIRWDLEYNKLEPLFDTLFHQKKDYHQRTQQIARNKIRFLEDARSAVLSDGRQYNVITDMMEFEYLRNRKDSVLKHLLSDMLKDVKVAKDEKMVLESTLNKW